MGSENVTRVKLVSEMLAEALVRRMDGHALRAVDNPLRLTMGWQDLDTGDQYEITLRDVKSSVSHLSDRLKELIVDASGREHLLSTAPTTD